MLSIYPACFFKEENGYSVIFPDLNWLSTCGDTVDTATHAAVDCLAGYIYLNEKYKESYPAPSSATEINLEKVALELNIHTTDSFINMISVDVELYAKEHFEKSVKKTLSIPSWLNKIAMEQNINFSQTLQEGLLQKIHIPDQK